MWICSVRASTLKFLGVVILSLATLFGLMIFVPEYEAAATGASAGVRYTDVRTNEDRLSFIAQFGYEVESEPIESCEFTVPAEFDRVLAGYNEIQRAQGLDLSRYAKKTVTRYTYTVNNTVDGKTAWVHLYVYKDRVVAGDITTAGPNGMQKALM